MQCFCGIKLLDKKQLLVHVSTKHKDILPARRLTNKIFDAATFKCRFCDFQENTEILRRYHLFTKHKDEIFEEKPAERKGRPFIV